MRRLLFRTALAVPRVQQLEQQVLAVVCRSGLWSLYRSSITDDSFAECG